MQQFEREDGAADQVSQSLASIESVMALWGPGNGAASTEQPGSGNLANSLAGLVHDARNVVAAIDLYCELLAEPEVLSAGWRHYAADLRLVSGAGRRLLDKLAIAAAQTTYDTASAAVVAEHQSRPSSVADFHFGAVAKHIQSHQTEPREPSSKPPRQPGRPMPMPLWPAGFRPTFPAVGHESVQIERVSEELRRILPLLSAVAGPGVFIEIADSPQDWPLPLTGEDLTRVMVNLVRNASEAMAGSGHIQIAVEETAGFVVLSVADEGPGIPREFIERVFQAGFSTHESQATANASGKTPEQTPATAWPVKHRGLGLSIVRSIVSAARGTVWAANRGATQTTPESNVTTQAPDVSLGGAVLFLELPLPDRSSSH